MSSDRTAELLDEIVRLLAVQIRLQVPTQTEAITAMAEAGLGPSRIAELLGTSSNTVNVAISRSRKAGTPGSR